MNTWKKITNEQAASLAVAIIIGSLLAAIYVGDDSLLILILSLASCWTAFAGWMAATEED